jgi:DNA-binding Lrp family transcriptional regulator
VLDERDRSIVEFLRSHPEASISDLAFGSHIPEPTVQRRLSKLLEQGDLKRIIAVNLSSLGYVLRYRIELALDPQEVAAKQKSVKTIAQQIREDLPTQPKFKGRLIVQNVFALMGGSADLAISVRAKNHDVVLNFVLEGLRNIPGVRSTTIVQEAWSAVQWDI